jgi:hypothetical protein
MTQEFSIKSTFNLDGFKDDCYLSGVKLFKRKDSEEVDGEYFTSAEKLTVTLFAEDPSKMSIVASKVPLYDDGQPGPTLAPLIITPRQIRVALILSNISLDTVDAAIQNLEEPDRSIAKASWEYSTEIDRDDPFINEVGALMGLTKEQIDNLFILGATV